ncbi:DUF4181 domain-containing protein [Sporolactobacillus sp. STSJ-5]|uniref:DUF4181 domain-containing protein n=1 Tax=Sporolactobacillus sp. STSJ-5 TaxID=2965076 RepID=UPI00210491F0|nr:DUF4181 domain-containing protein [Sporolactobacillus sp. STSJ-5]MCQ2009954.1 DUF4181 domain-containing protein [Sporolactobacillus sp. STSJ-5]
MRNRQLFISYYPAEVFLTKIIPFFIVGTIFSASNLLVNHYLKRKYNIAKSKGWFYHPLNRFHSSMEAFLFVLFIIALFFFNAEVFGIIAYVTVINGLRALMEWRYEHEKKHYLLSLSSTVFLTIFFGVVVATRILPI